MFILLWSSPSSILLSCTHVLHYLPAHAHSYYYYFAQSAHLLDCVSKFIIDSSHGSRLSNLTQKQQP